jgi:hypothetical protein
MVKGTCLAALQRRMGTPQRLGPGSPRSTAPVQRYLTRSKHKQSINKMPQTWIKSIFLRLGTFCKYFSNSGVRLKNYGLQVNFGKIEGLKCKMSKIGFFRNCFPKENSWIESTSLWTAPARSNVDRAHCRSRELAGAWPPAALVPESSVRGLGEREGGPAISMAGLPRLGRRWKSVSPVTETLARKDDGEGAVRSKREGVRGVGGFTEGGVDFYRAEARPSAFIGRR